MQEEHSLVNEPVGFFARLELALLRWYKQFVSPVLGAGCRYTPTCSVYAMQALARHGVVRGNLMIVGRLLRCAPWGRGGFDPVEGLK